MNYFKRFLIVNFNAFMVMGLIIAIGFTFGGRFGLGIALTLILLIQIFC